MLDLSNIAAVFAQRKPGHALPQALYNSPDVLAFDLEAIFGQSWILAGFTCEIPRPRGTLALTVGASPVVITRDRDGELKAFHNSCRHRGAQVCADGASARARLTCPYHQWVYGLDGKLVHAKNMQESFDPSQHGLKPIHLEEVAGAIFVCMADRAPAFDRFRAHLEPLLAPHRLNEAKLAHQNTLVEKGNWKLVMENARECYHCAVGHPELALTFPVGEARGDHFAKEGDPRHAAYEARLAACGLQKGPYDGPWWQVERFPLREGQVSLTMDGQPAVKKLMIAGEEPDVGSLRWAIEPHSFCHSTADTTVYFSAMPTARNETLVTCKWLVHQDAVEGVDYDVERLTDLWNITNRQDRDLVELNQRGVNSLGYEPGPYCEDSESYVMRFTDWYCDKAQDFIAARTGLDLRPRAINEVPSLAETFSNVIPFVSDSPTMAETAVSALALADVAPLEQRPDAL
ncbi:aromatic ring-hydroxylating dioxygenase subunit alpha [Aurantimonas sp. VKM B-3413]|uniref:aromatic ring-hydroxylating oxygenase subunit alpha n=1 Tax=Aurantimonas sp. VKM B-3413 TaxID=2779401 RepID=UPI001E5C5373|nr:aromatic ring-hydroxylating dioxygenase subunit alpha [Aurantimonas sp. VKM B-3413]MCB8836447.1 aromatic ring-hydroxylating dioxygenase subunit alpha [Aurantimonas sp. VKM B-3413]